MNLLTHEPYTINYENHVKDEDSFNFHYFGKECYVELEDGKSIVKYVDTKKEVEDVFVYRDANHINKRKQLYTIYFPLGSLVKVKHREHCSLTKA